MVELSVIAVHLFVFMKNRVNTLFPLAFVPHYQVVV